MTRLARGKALALFEEMSDAVELGVNSYSKRLVLARLDAEGKARGQRGHFF